MRYRRVLFYIPPFPGIEEYPGQPHTGIGYLAEMLDRHGIEYEVVDLRLGYTVGALLKRIHRFNPDLVASTMMTYRHDLAYHVLSEIKSSAYETVIGGPHVSTMGAAVLEECDADFAIALEGESPLLQLCQGRPFESIPGLIYRDRAEIRTVPPSPPQRDLDQVPFPTYRGFELEKYNSPQMPVVSSRGCPCKCVYCTVGVTMGRRLRVRSAENVAAEIDYWYSRGYRKFVFNDDNFALYRKRVSDLCELIERLGRHDIVFKCPNGLRADAVDRELLLRMRSAGFTQLSFGVEAGNDRVLASIKKGEKMSDMESAVQAACEIGYDVTLFFLVGSPGETLADVDDSIRFAKKYPLYEAMFYNLIPFPGTELFGWVEENGRFLIEPAVYLNSASCWDKEPVFETPEFPALHRKAALRRTRQVMQDVKTAMYRRKLAAYPVLGWLAGTVLGLPRTQRIISRNRYARRVLIFFAHRLQLWR